MVNKVEAILDAVCQYTGGMNDPESDAYKLRNPLMVRSFAQLGKHQTDGKGHRVFSSFINGYKAGVFDLECKINGRTRANVTPNSPLEALLGCYEIRGVSAVDCIVSFLRIALEDPEITGKTPLTYFSQQ